MDKTRENNYDLLRIICTVAVISVHVSGWYMEGITGTEAFGTYYLAHIPVSCLYNVLPRFAVPCFLMLSGAFLLADERNGDFGYFYRKEFKNVGIPAFIFSGIYFAYSFISGMIGAVTGHEWSGVIDSVKLLVKGEPFYHMWYLYMLLGVYLMAPVVIRVKHEIKEKNFTTIVGVFLALACVSDWTSTHKLSWDIGSSFCYLGYFMAGYEIRKWAQNKKSNGRAAAVLAGGILVELLAVWFRYAQAMERIADSELNYTLVNPLSPLIVISSLLIFAGFSLLKIEKDFRKVSKHTFFIYLAHAGIWGIFQIGIGAVWGMHADNRIVIPAGIAVVFLLSYLLAVLCGKYSDK